VAGEFDSTVHPNWTVFTAANTSEAFPGPMTPLSLELSLETLRAGGAQATEVLRLDGELKRVLREEPIASFGHGIYANLSAIYAMGSVMPGGAATAYQDMLFGDGAELPEFDRIGRWGIARRLPLIAAQLTGFGAELRDIAATARASQHDASYYATLTDAQLQARLLRTRDEIAQCWAGSGQATAFVVPLMSLLEKQAGKGFATRIRGGTSELMSAGIASGAYKLADIARADSDISATLCNHSGEEALQILRKNQPEFAQSLDTVINEYGHRGPRETELANPVFADTPGRLLDVVAKLLNTTTRQAEPAAPLSTRLQLLASVGSRFQRSREQVRDATIRQTHQYRLIARELGTRLARKGVIDAPEDVFYLVRAELKNPPKNAKELIARRRAERQRLEVQRPPLHIVGSWQPTTDGPSELAAGESLQGIPVSAGIAKGTARILTVDSMDELEPGEILVTAFTDTGWTPFFAYAAAVVVDTGGEMSHAAVVAREFGIPCVVNTVTGSSALRTGHVLEVDGATGRVTRVE
jgi:phosphohistidine swiveling domain-containing protein